jgi:tRNA pseudouridine55 synthase
MARAAVRTDGILLVDKPGGCTSHDVVARARRAFGQREVGHAGTLDPMATGLLVLLLGEATKLSAYLTADDKAYVATIEFGVTTDTLDADGVVVNRSDAAAPAREDIERTLAAMIGPMKQVPPSVSAIKRGGVASHARVRRGEVVELEPRDVSLASAVLRDVSGSRCTIEIACSKGFYVRSLARDLAERHGTVGCLVALRRTRTGAFDVREAVHGDRVMLAARGDASATADVRSAVRPIGEARRSMRTIEATDDEARALACGKAIAREETDGVVLVMRADGVPVCIGSVSERVLRVVRGFRVTDVPARAET